MALEAKKSRCMVPASAQLLVTVFFLYHNMAEGIT
jgi:hypothetical protein